MSKVIGKFIKVRRAELGLSQNDLARSLGYNTSQYISNIERGLASIPFAKILEMSDLLKVDYRHLLNLKLMEEVPGFKEEFLGTKPVANGSEVGMSSIPVMTPELCANWTDLGDLDFPRKICNRFEYARTEDPRAFYFEAHLSDLNLIGIRDGDLLLVEPSHSVNPGSIVLSVRAGDFRLIKILPRNGEVILQPIEEKGELEIVLRKEIQFFAVSELKRRLSHN